MTSGRNGWRWAPPFRLCPVAERRNQLAGGLGLDLHGRAAPPAGVTNFRHARFPCPVFYSTIGDCNPASRTTRHPHPPGARSCKARLTTTAHRPTRFARRSRCRSAGNPRRPDADQLAGQHLPGRRRHFRWPGAAHRRPVWFALGVRRGSRDDGLPHASGQGDPVVKDKETPKETAKVNPDPLEKAKAPDPFTAKPPAGKDPLEKLGVSETKTSDPKKNPLDKGADDLLKDIK